MNLKLHKNIKITYSDYVNNVYSTIIFGISDSAIRIQVHCQLTLLSEMTILHLPLFQYILPYFHFQMRTLLLSWWRKHKQSGEKSSLPHLLCTLLPCFVLCFMFIWTNHLCLCPSPVSNWTPDPICVSSSTLGHHCRNCPLLHHQVLFSIDSLPST